MSDAPLQHTPLYELHLELGAKMVPFAGYAMPVSYPAGILAEHRHCRDSAALFDVSHMGQVRLVGDDAALAAFHGAPGAEDDPESREWDMYRNAWWVLRQGREYSGIGIFGQYCWVNRDTRTVIARCRSFPAFVATYQVGTIEAVFEQLRVDGQVRVCVEDIANVAIEASW